MRNPIYSAKFICGDPKWVPVCPVFRKEFTLNGDVRRAELHISALGVYEARINGSRVGEDYMAPGWTVYPKRLQYFTYDVTAMLGEQNAVEVGVGSGWYSSRGGFQHSINGMYGHYPELILALEIFYASGERELIITDESWLAAPSEVLFSTIYDGETVDARIIPEFKEQAMPSNRDTGILIPREGECVRVTDRVAVRNVIHTPKGECVLDFGQEITGTVEFKLNAKGGETVTVEHGEMLDRDGNFYNENYRSAKSLITYTARPGEQVYRARYTFFGFRYLKLNNWCCEVHAEDFTGIVLHSDMKRTGYFECGHGKLNKLYSNVIWGQRDNFLDVPTDCPQRDERLGWTGDAQVFARTACINYDAERFFTKWLRDMAAEQLPDGSIPYIVPHVFTDVEYNSTAWSDAACIIPWELYMAYGNKKLLREHLPMMKKWVNYIYTRPGKRYMWENGTHFGDWLALDVEGSNKGGTNRDLIANAYYYYVTRLVALACRELGLNSERYEKMAERIGTAYRREYIKRGRLISDTQTAHAITIAFGLTDGEPELKARLGARLVELIEANGDRLNTGFVGTPCLLDALTAVGRSDKAYTLLLQEKFPSWLFSVNMGATTIWEHWDSVREDGTMWSISMNSFNHYAYGSVAAWMYRTVTGIKPTSPAYKTFDLSPVPNSALGFARSRIETRGGEIISEWRYEGDSVRYCFTVPEGTTATLKLIDGTTELLCGGSYVRWTKI